jgi:hypothetical protein
MASPLGGPTVHNLVQELDAALCARPHLAALPGRFLFTIDDGTGDVAWLTTDIAALLPPTSPAVLPPQPLNPIASPGPAVQPDQPAYPPTNHPASPTSPAALLGQPASHPTSAADPTTLGPSTSPPPSQTTTSSTSPADPTAWPDRLTNPATSLGISPTWPAAPLSHPANLPRSSQAISPIDSADSTVQPGQPANASPSHSTSTPPADPTALPGQSANSPISSADAAVILLGGVDVGLRAARGRVVSIMLECAERFLALRTNEWRLAEIPSGPARVASGFPLVDQVMQPTVGHRRGVGIGAPLGRLTVAQGLALAAAATELVITPWRRVVLDPPPSVAMLEQLASLGLIIDPDAPAVTACVGRPGCAKALADVRSDAVAMLARTSLPVHWSGCARRCGRPRGEVLDMIATETGYVTRRGNE